MVRRRIQLFSFGADGRMISHSYSVRRLLSLSSSSSRMKRFGDNNVKLNKDLKAPRDSNSSFNNVGTDGATCAALSSEDLCDLSLRDLINLEHQYHGYLRNIRAKKEKLLLEQLEDLKEQVSKPPRSKNEIPDTPEESMDSSHVEN